MTRRAAASNHVAIKDRIIGSGRVSPDDLIANPRNWRLHPDHQAKALGAVLDEIGWVQQVILNKRTGHLVDGHLRVTLAAQRGEPVIPVVYVDLSESEEAVILATLDPLAAMAGTDSDKLGSLLDDMEGSDELLASMVEDLMEREAQIPGALGGYSDNMLNQRGGGRMHRNEGTTEVVAVGRFIGAADRALTERARDRLERFEDSAEAAAWACERIANG